MVRREHGGLVFCCLASILIGSLTTSQLPAQDDSSSTKRRQVAVDFLSQIEDRALPLPLMAGVARHETLPDYYWEANTTLRYRLDEATRAFAAGGPHPYRAMTIVAGSAGVGKTFIKRQAYSDQVPDDQVWKFDIRELLTEMAKEGLAESRPDLRHDNAVINRLPSLTPDGRKTFNVRLAEKAPAFVVVDSLDEIHPDDYVFVLEQLEQLALRGDRDFIHVVVFGRPLAFRDYWQQHADSGLPHGLRGFLLHAPDFRTTGDLLVSSWNYDSWKHRLSRVGVDGRRDSMSLSDYQHWCDGDFATSGEFSNVSFEQNSSMCPEVRDELLRWTQKHRVVLGVLPNLAGNSILRDIVDAHVQRDQPFNERAFMNEFFAKWLERDTKSDDRPSQLKPKHLELYVKLLEAVAVKFMQEHRVSRLGYFDVEDEDSVTVEHEGNAISVPVQQLLNRSGLVTLDPILPVAQRYRFEPLWIHRLLVEQHYERQAGEAPPTGVKIAAE